eukprot:6179347-Pleurochrysis_carterae.AAC.2
MAVADQGVGITLTAVIHCRRSWAAGCSLRSAHQIKHTVQQGSFICNILRQHDQSIMNEVINGSGVPLRRYLGSA